MIERELKIGSACFLIKDERLKKDWHESPIFDFIKEEGFICWEKSKKNIEGIDWLFINPYSKVYAKGVPGIGLAPVVCEHAITFDEFLTIYNIYKKYSGLGTLKMNKEEQLAFLEKMYPERKKTIGYRHQKYWDAASYSDTNHIPAINDILKKYKEKAKTTPVPDWYVKWAALYFTYEEETYVIGAGDISAEPEVFDVLEREITEDLYLVGAYDMFYAGMMD